MVEFTRDPVAHIAQSMEMTIQDVIREQSEPIIQRALKDVELRLRDAVAAVGMRIAERVSYSTMEQEILIKVDLKSLQKTDD